MKQQAFLSVGILISGLLGTAWGHGTSDAPETLTSLSDDSILHRLKQLGYSEVQVVRTNRESVDVTLQREGKKYKATVSRSLIGPGSIAVVNVAEVVEQMLRTVDISIPDDLPPRIERKDTGSSSETIRIVIRSNLGIEMGLAALLVQGVSRPVRSSPWHHGRSEDDQNDAAWEKARPLGEEAVLADSGRAGEKSDFFSILLKFWNAQRFADHQGSG